MAMVKVLMSSRRADIDVEKWCEALSSGGPFGQKAGPKQPMGIRTFGATNNDKNLHRQEKASKPF